MEKAIEKCVGIGKTINGLGLCKKCILINEESDDTRTVVF